MRAIDPSTPRRPRSGRPAGVPLPAAARARGNGEFPGPILGGRVQLPTRRERRRARRRRRRPVERVLRGLVVVVALLVLVVGLGYGYFRYQWSKVASLPCATCVPVAGGQPYNVLVIGSDTRVGETAAEARHFGPATGGQRSDTIKVVHVDPATGTASVLSIPRDTYVTLSGLPAGTGLSAGNKINAAFNDGPVPLVETVERTFGIPISHFIVINFFGLQDAVDALGGINLDFPYPVRDQKCDGSGCRNMSGLSVTTTGCQVVDGPEALGLSRSRYFQYDKGGTWIADPTSDIGRIERQNLIVEAALDKAKSTYNPLRLNALLSSVTHDFTKDDALSAGDLLGLAERYHAFSGSDLNAVTLPTTGAPGTPVGDAEVVQEPAAQQMIAAFLGTAPAAVTTPPLDASGDPLTVPGTASPGASALGSAAAGARAELTALGHASPAAPAVDAASSASAVPPYDPRPC